VNQVIVVMAATYSFTFFTLIWYWRLRYFVDFMEENNKKLLARKLLSLQHENFNQKNGIGNEVCFKLSQKNLITNTRENPKKYEIQFGNL